MAAYKWKIVADSEEVRDLIGGGLGLLRKKTEINCRDLGKPKNPVRLNNFGETIRSRNFLG